VVHKLGQHLDCPEVHGNRGYELDIGIPAGGYGRRADKEVIVMFGSSVKLDGDLLKRCRQHAQDAGYSSVEEFITHVLERELKSKQGEAEKDQEEIARRLQGLGYIE
jgi:hypothetical protein